MATSGPWMEAVSLRNYVMDDIAVTAVSELLTILTPEWIYRYQVVPLKKTGGTLYLGLKDPTDQNVINAIMFHTGLKIYPQTISDQEWLTFIEAHCQTHTTHALPELPPEETTLTIEEHESSYNDPIIQFVDYLLREAFQKTASDIHIEPFETHCRIRFRQDGILYKITELSNPLALRLITRLKVMSKCDISERRLPQDGRMQWQQDQQKIDIRINTCPTVCGEKVVLRILDAGKTTLSIDNLGLFDGQKNIFHHKISAPQGLILVTGPTSSGKTVTLYSALQFLNTVGKNISTVEDPVEIRLQGINQVNINPKIGLTFAAVLRTFLRQDPDVIMVGEIRDTETAEIAIQAAHTGHLVLSTLHTSNTLEAISRLQAMGVQPYHLVNSITLIIAQRLVRKLCNACKQPDTLARTAAFRAGECPRCLQGYKGRIGIYELLPMTATLAQLITSATHEDAITAYLQKSAFNNLSTAGMQRVAEGTTSLSEIQRVLRT